ncbi:MAG: hypothetical protein M1817_005069 [Caeruleum heppii]|nr:MAG: hypothetical protein M1817_005069 [Caeruleum heppii]
MTSVGPQLPPHLLAKRKRQLGDDQSRDAPSPPRSPSPTAASPTNSDGSGKRRRILGPSLPPAPIAEQPSTPADVDESSSDDDIGPALPPGPGQKPHDADDARRQTILAESEAQASIKKPQREEWMLVPPKGDDWSSKVDPTKLRNRKFNTGKGAKAPPVKSGPDHALWSETPEQKLRRLQDEVMGVQKAAGDGSASPKNSRDLAEAEATARRIQEYNEKNRGQSLYNEHKVVGPREKEDDPSQRAFDREKDIAGGQKIGHAQRKELLNRAADFGSKFAGGKYL